MTSLAQSVYHLPGLFRLGLVSRVLRVTLAVIVGVLCYQLSPTDFEQISRLMMGWDGFLLAVLQLTWLTIFRTHAGDIERASPQMYPERTWVLLLTVTFVGTATSLLAVVLLLRGLHQMTAEERVEHVLVSLVAVAGTWLLLHTLFALHYAHTYFSQQQQPGPTPDDERGGLRFGGAPPASYWDFAYFSFVVGMTTQTADVTVTSLRMRRLVLFHGLLSFVFNTAIVALSINILSGLL